MAKIQTVMDEEMAARGQQSVTVELTGVESYVRKDADKIEITLSGITPVEVNWQIITDTFKAAGISQDDADFLCNSFANQTEVHLLAKALAARMRRVW
jgi:hypothetical protein